MSVVDLAAERLRRRGVPPDTTSTCVRCGAPASYLALGDNDHRRHRDHWLRPHGLCGRHRRAPLPHPDGRRVSVVAFDAPLTGRG